MKKTKKIWFHHFLPFITFYPRSWQGWLVTAAYISIFIFLIYLSEMKILSDYIAGIGMIVITVVIWIIAFIFGDSD